MPPALGQSVPAGGASMAGRFGSGWPGVTAPPQLRGLVPLQSNYIGNVAVQRSADTQQRFHADMLALSHVGDHVGGKTGGQPQVLFPHATLLQGVP